MEITFCPNCKILFDDTIKWNNYNIQTHLKSCEKKNKVINSCINITNFFCKLTICNLNISEKFLILQIK